MSLWIAVILALIGCGSFGLRAYLRLVGRRLARPHRADEIHFAETADGFRLALYRYRPASFTPGREPVILCHGLASNRLFLDYDERCSLARYLRGRGFDCWVAELRGRGLSQPIQGPLPWGWRFDDYVEKDLPAILAAVRRAADRPAALWVGHSMGGMVMYAYLGNGGEGVRAFAAMGSPAVFFKKGYPAPVRALARLLTARLPYLPFHSLARLAAPLVYLAPVEKFGHLRPALAGYAAHGIVNTSSQVLAQFLDWIENQTFRSADRSKDYLERLRPVTTPFLAVLGAKDWTATPRMCRPAFETIGSADKQLMLFGREHGQRQEYDHAGLALGRHAPDEIFPPLADWLLAHASA